MPLEPLPWDRKEHLLRDRRKHDRSAEVASESYRYPQQGYGGVMGVSGGGPRWRESHSHPNPKTNPYPYPHHPYRSPSPRWTSEFRSKPGPSGYGKQGSRHFFPEDGHRFVQSRPNDRFLEDERFRASGAGRYTKFSKESKPFPSQKDIKGSFREAAPSPDGPGRQNDASAQQKTVDLLLASNSNPHSNSSYSCDQSQPKEPHEKNDGHDAPVSSEPKEQLEKNDGLDAPVSSSHKFERANSFASIDWRTKWTGPGSLPSRSYSFSHSSISKSIGVDCNEVKIDDTTILSPSGDDDNPVATAHVASATETCTTSEETSRCKKRRLGWGEGLAKYEKKKVEHTDDSVLRNDVMVCSSSGEEMHVVASDLTDKSPTINSFPEFPSPTTPPAISSGPLPVTEEKQLLTDGSIDHVKANFSLSPVTQKKQLTMDGSILHDKAKLSVSPGVVYQYHLEKPNFKLENLDLEPIACLNSAIDDQPLSDDSSSVCSDFVTSTAINKLAVLKGDVLKVLELTESDIDKFECELKSMSEQETILEKSSSSSFLPVDCVLESTHNRNAASAITCQRASLEIVSHAEMPYAEELPAADVKNEDVDMYSSGKGFSADLENQVQSPLRPDKVPYICWDAKSSSDGLNGDETYLNASYGSQLDDKLCEGILVSNRDSAIRSAEVFNKLLPANKCTSDIPIAIENTEMIKAKFLERKRFLQFKERVLALKFRAFQHLWEEDVHALSMGKFRVRSQKRMDLSLRPANSGIWKYRSPIHSRVAGDTCLLANTEMINFVGKLISNNQVKPLRKALKMPAFILDEKEKTMCRFVNTNGLVEDPCAVEKGRSLLNTWTEEEKEIFIDKLSTCGKDFTKIASFIVHKTTANCIEFYYKNHKSEWFQRPAKEGKSYLTNHYLITSGKRRIPEGNAASLDTLGAATVIASNAYDCMDIQQNVVSKNFLDTTACKVSRNSSGLQQRSASVDLDDSEREAIAADVLAGICGSLSSEATSSSCITSAIDPREDYHERKKYKKKCASSRLLPLTTEVSQSVGDETCSGESIQEMDDANWTDEENSMFIQAVSSYGKDFAMISRHIKTRTVDQCKIFFSKARKCASLDTICLGSANVVCTEANDAGTDADCGSVDPGLHVFIEKSGIKTEGYLSSPDMKLTSEPDDAHSLNAALPVSNGLERNDVSFDMQTADSKNPLDNVTEISQVEMPEQVLGVDGMGHNSKMVAVPCGSTSVIPSHIEAVDNNSNDNNLSDQPDRQSVEKLSSDVAGRGPFFSETNVNEGSQKENVIPRNVSASEHDIKLKMHTSHAADIASCFHDISGSPQVNLHPDSLEKPCGLISSPQGNYPLPVNLVSGVFGAAKCGRASHEVTSIDFAKNGGQGHRVSTSGLSLLDGGAACPKISADRASAVVSTAREVNSDISCKQLVTASSIARLNNNFHFPHGSLLQKCNGTKQNSPMSELPLQSVEQLSCNPSSQSDAFSGVDKPKQGGNFKLFGQILTKPSLRQKLSQSIRQHRNGENQHEAGKSFSVKLTGDSSVGGNPVLEKLDRNNFLDSENPPPTSFAVWDGSRIQTGFGLPVSVKPLTKYPDAFRNYPMSSKIEQPPLHEINGGNRSLDGLSIIPGRTICSTNRVFDYQMVSSSRDMQPVALDMQQQPEVVLPKTLRNRLEGVSGVEKTARGIVGIQCGGNGNIVVGRQHSGFSDSVAAMNLRMHYSQPKQFNGQTGSMIRDDCWMRDQGNIGR